MRLFERQTSKWEKELAKSNEQGQDLITKANAGTVGSYPCRRLRLCAPSGEPFSHAESGAHGYGDDMDEVVFCY